MRSVLTEERPRPALGWLPAVKPWARWQPRAAGPSYGLRRSP
jgi:hypothetical protein